MGLNFYDYHDFQPKIRGVQNYETHCSYQVQLTLRIDLKKILALKYMNGSLQGLSVTQCSWVYGSAFVTTIVFSPIFGKYIEVIGSRKLFLYGTFLAGATNVLFGFLQWIEDQNLFLALSLSIRIVSVKVAYLVLTYCRVCQ